MKPQMSASAAMSTGEYREAVASIGLTLTAFGPWIGAHEQSGRRWAVIGPPPTVTKLLRLLVVMRHTAETADKLTRRLDHPATAGK